MRFLRWPARNATLEVTSVSGPKSQSTLFGVWLIAGLTIFTALGTFPSGRAGRAQLTRTGNSPTAPATVADRLGFNIHFTDPLPGEMTMLAASGVGWVRMDFKWSLTERERGKYDFSEYDRLVAALVNSHLRAMFILDYANPLYDHNLSPVSDEGRKAFASWAAAAVTHFRGHGFLWEIYNEPDAFWQPHPDTDAYVKLALATSEAVAEAAPEERVIGPASAAIDPAFLEACFRAGLLNYWSAVTIHPYRESDPETAAADLRNVRLLIRKYAPPGKTIPVMAGEWGYSSSATGMGESKQARLLAREWLFDIANDVSLTIWYDWHTGGAPDDRERNFGVVNPPAGPAYGGQSPPFKPKPAYLAAQTLNHMLGDFTFNKRIALAGPQDNALLFTKGDETRLAVWTAGAPHAVVLPTSPGEFSDTNLIGEQLPAIEADRKGLSVTLTNEPQYLAPQQLNDLLSVAAAWQRLPLEIELRAPGVLPLHLALKNPLPKAEKFSVRAVGVPSETEGSVKAQPGAVADLLVRVAATERSAKPTRLGAELRVEKLGYVGQETAIVASNPLRVTLMPATERYLPVSVVNLAADTVRGSLRAFGSGLRFESAEEPIEMAPGVIEIIVKLPLASPPQPDYSAGVEIDDRDGDRVFFLPSSPFHLIADFGGSPAPRGLTNYSLTPEGGAQPGNLDLKLPSEGPPQPGMGALQVSYDLPGANSVTRLKQKDGTAISGRPVALGLWIYGDGSGMLPYTGFVDSSGQTFREGGGPLNWKGWRYVLILMDVPRGKHWGGANDGVIHYPIHWDDLLEIQNSSDHEAKGTLYLSGPVLIYGPAANSR